MTIAWNLFTPWTALAAALFLLGTGRVAGISGLVARPLAALWTRLRLQPEVPSLLFIAGLLAAPWAWRMVAPLPAATLDVGPLGLVAAGLLVGVGTRMGNGCTSGHGVCGLSRLSPRSLVATGSFMGAGFLTVYLVRHVI